MSDKKANNTINLQRLKKLIDGEQSRQVIADKIGCDVSLITKHYNGDRIVTIDYLKKYAKYFKVSTDYLLNLSDVKTTDKDLQFVCNYTGLNEETINYFASLDKDDIYYFYNDNVKSFIEILVKEICSNDNQEDLNGKKKGTVSEC